MRRKLRLAPYLFVLPAILIYGVFLLLPLLQTVLMSFWQWDGLSPHYLWVGAENYVRLFQDSAVWSAALNNIKWVLLAILPIVLGLFLGVALHQARPRGRNTFRLLFFLPYVLPTVVIAVSWQWIYQPSTGALNTVLRAVGLAGLQQNWLGDPHIALIALAIAADWAGYGFCMVLFLAGLNAIDPSLYDAASVDGANGIQKFFHVTLPGVGNTTTTVVLIVFINTVRVFDIVYVMTGGGPANSTEVLGTQIYRQSFQNLDIGYGAAVAVFMAVVILIFTVVFLRVRERTEA